MAPVVFSQTPSLADLDRDGIPNTIDFDIDNDGMTNGRDRNIDGGTARSGPLRGKYVGDKLPNNHSAEIDMDADGLADNSVDESDIDGDGLMDSDRKLELDVDGDGVANGLDADVDSDGLANKNDTDMYGDGELNDIFIGGGAEEAYANDDTVKASIAYVSGELRRIFQIPVSDNGIRVRVHPNQFGNLVTGVWRYLSADNMQVYANWCYSADNPQDLKVFVIYRYNGPYSNNPDDYSNPSFYSVSEESRVYAQYPRGPFTFISWLPLEPAGFYYTEPNEQATGFAPPYEALKTALSAFPNFSSDPQYLSFSGDLTTTPGLTTLQPVINLQRTIMQVNRIGYGRLEARAIR